MATSATRNGDRRKVAPMSNDRGLPFDRPGDHLHPDGPPFDPVEEEGVEVVLGGGGEPLKVMDSPHSHESRRRDGGDQNVFRASSARGRPHYRAPVGGAPPPQSGGSFGYGHPQYPHNPVPVPYNNSESFEDSYHHHHQQQQQQQHYSPHVQYPQPGRYPSEDVNVISPSHASQKGDSPQGKPPRAPYENRHAPPPGYYQYPPASPVSRPEGSSSSSRSKQYGENRESDVPYQGDSSSYHPDDGTWNPFPHAADQRPQPGLVTESSFDSEHYQASQHSSQYSSHPPTPGGFQGGLPPYDAQQQFYGGGGSWGSFDSQQGVPPPQFDDQRYYGYPPAPDSPYTPYSPGAPYYGEPYPTHYSPYGRSQQQAYEDDERRMMRDYGPDPGFVPSVTPSNGRKGKTTPVASNASNKGMVLPQAAFEVNFEVTNPPPEPYTHPSSHPVCRAPGDINRDDVLCGRGGGTNSQIGNRRFRKLVQEFQPTYLMARRKEKPRLARTIVLIIRNRGGRFLKKDDETGEYFEVGDAKAEAKTSQALREGLDVRATKSAASSLVTDKKKKSKKDTTKEDAKAEVKDEPKEKAAAKEEEQKDGDKEEKKDDKADEIAESPPRLKESPPEVESSDAAPNSKPRDRTPSPPPQIPKLQGEAPKAGVVHPHSPDALQFRKRRRMRSGGCIPLQDKLFPDFCPPRADLCRASSPDVDDDETSTMNVGDTPPRRNATAARVDDDDTQPDSVPQSGCADIAMMMMTGAASGGLCLGPKWRSSSR